jgi:hypothetical protein
MMTMLAAAEEISGAAKKHEEYLRLVAARWGELPDTSDYAVVGESFAPLSQALASWRRLMTAIFPLPEPKPEVENEIAQWLSENHEQVRGTKERGHL